MDLTKLEPCESKIVDQVQYPSLIFIGGIHATPFVKLNAVYASTAKVMNAVKEKTNVGIKVDGGVSNNALFANDCQHLKIT